MRKFLVFLLRYAAGFALILCIAKVCASAGWQTTSNLVSLFSFAYLLGYPVRAAWRWSEPGGGLTSPKLYRLWFLNAFNDKS